MTTAGAKWRHLIALSLATLLAMSLWFSATAVVPSLIAEWGLTGGQAAWLTMSVQLGFVTGALLSALFNVPDLLTPRGVFTMGALSGAVLNALIPALEPSLAVTVALRFGTGMSLAAVYPVGMKIIATWTKKDRGLAIGLLVGALTVGSAFPHLIRSLGSVRSWESVMYLVSFQAAGGGLIGWSAGHLGPYRAPTPRFHWRHMGASLRLRSLRLANFGYLGHMWELYAMWTWIPLYLAASYRASGMSPEATTTWASLAAFAIIAAGGPGSVLAGRLADGWGRTRTTIASMGISGGCALSIGAVFGAPPWAVTLIGLLWGFTIVADSAQFSASISELSEREYMGTQLTTQTAMGFLLTMASIRMIPGIVDQIGWRWVFVVLVPGPLFGIRSMWRLLRSPDASKLAGGRG